MNLSLVAVPLALATADWIAVGMNWKGLRYIAKPGVMLALLALLWMFTGFREGMVLFAVALGFSMLGDIALILPKERFKGALICFLLAHLSFIAAYNQYGPAGLLPSLVILAGLVYLAIMIFDKISVGLSVSGNSNLRRPIMVYMMVQIWMVFSAVLTLLRPTWTPVPAILTSIGALLFLYSDSTLAWNRFVKPLPHGRLKVIVSYHLAQIMMIIAAIQHFQTILADKI
jgi:alkenylglycerophosphocholine hydrolase